METVKNVGSHPVDLSDGRTLGPGETAEDVATGNTHNKDLIDQGHLRVVGEPDDGPVAEYPKAEAEPAKNDPAPEPDDAAPQRRTRPTGGSEK